MIEDIHAHLKTGDLVIGHFDDQGHRLEKAVIVGGEKDIKRLQNMIVQNAIKYGYPPTRRIEFEL